MATHVHKRPVRVPEIRKGDTVVVMTGRDTGKRGQVERVIRLTTKFKAHDETNDARIGDTVLIEEARPLSATKRWRLVSVVQRGGDHALPGEIVAEEAETTEAIHAAAHPGRTRTDDDETATAEADEAGS